MKNLLWMLWGAMIFSMFLKWKADTYMVVAVIILPILIVLLDLQEEVLSLKEDAKHQRKFTLDRISYLTDKMKDLSSQFEKKLVVDFAEFAKTTPPSPDFQITKELRRKKKKMRKPEGQPAVDLTRHPISPPPEPSGPPEPTPPEADGPTGEKA